MLELGLLSSWDSCRAGTPVAAPQGKIQIYGWPGGSWVSRTDVPTHAMVAGCQMPDVPSPLCPTRVGVE